MTQTQATPENTTDLAAAIQQSQPIDTPEPVDFENDIALMLNHPAVAQSAAVAVPDEKRGESVKLFVVLKPDYQDTLSEQGIIDWAKDNTAAYKYPRHVEFRDSLPASGTGKLLRRLLKDPAPPASQ